MEDSEKRFYDFGRICFQLLKKELESRSHCFHMQEEMENAALNTGLATSQLGEIVLVYPFDKLCADETHSNS